MNTMMLAINQILPIAITFTVLAITTVVFTSTRHSHEFRDSRIVVSPSTSFYNDFNYSNYLQLAIKQVCKDPYRTVFGCGDVRSFDKEILGKKGRQIK